jgi:hypothetical protein
MKALALLCLTASWWLALPAATAQDDAALPDGMRHIGDYLVTTRLKITDAEVTRVTIKPFRISVYTNGSEVRVAAAGDRESSSSFKVYRSDGIGRQAARSAALEVVPGLQASSDQGGTLAHLRLCPACLTITRFPGVSNQTIVTHAVAVARTTPKDAAATSPPNPPSR